MFYFAIKSTFQVEEKEIHDELAAIRGLMERSSKFISLSGLSGILAGVYSLVGAGAAYLIIKNNPINNSGSFSEDFNNGLNLLTGLGATALAVLVVSIITSIVLSGRKAKKNGQSMWNKTSRLLLFNMGIPLLTGGLFILILLYNGHGYFDLILPSMLVFYGLALVSASNFTFTDVKYLGLLEIALGLIAACFPGYGLLFWAFGFGVLHIVYGSMMYLKYDR
jgi:hypothetical protein